MLDIDGIMALLRWNSSSDEQEQGIHLAKQVKCLSAFFQPVCDSYAKDVWDNCAIVIAKRSDSELQPYVLNMLLWLQDMNWPGSITIRDRLLEFKDTEILAYTLRALVTALSSSDENTWLSGLSQLLDNLELIGSLDQDTITVLNTHRSYS